MKLRTLFLGTAAAVAVGGYAQAADLAVAVEPVDYVKVCDAFGTGYYYIPGTDTCLKIAGQVRIDIYGYSDPSYALLSGYGSTGSTTLIADGTTAGSAVAGVGYQTGAYSSSWAVRTRAAFNMTAQTMSDLGPIVTYMAFVVEANNADWNGSVTNEDWTVRSDGMYGAIGPVMFGWVASTFDPGGGYNYGQDKRSDKKTDQVRFSYNMGGWGLMLGLEDPRDRWGAAATGDMPDIILALTGGAGAVKFGAAVGVADLTTGTGWGVQANAVIDLGGGSRIKAEAAYADGAGSFTGTALGSGTSWSAMLTGILALSSNTDLRGTVSYTSDVNGVDTWWVAVGPRWYPTSNSEVGVDLNWTDPNNASSYWSVNGRLKTWFNGG